MGEPISISELEHLMKQSKFQQIQHIVQGTRPSDWVRKDGATLLHLAATHCSNPELTEYLVDTGYDVNAETSAGETPLSLALKSDNFRATKILLDADADVFVNDPATGKIILNTFVTKRRRMIERILPHLMRNFKRRNYDTETIVALLIAADWPMEYILALRDPQMNREYIKNNPTGDYRKAVEVAMIRRDFETVELILRHSNRSGRKAFYQNLNGFICGPNMHKDKFELYKMFLERWSDWDVLCEDGVRILGNIARSTYVQKYAETLLEDKIVEQARKKFGIDWRLYMFGNWTVDVLKILENPNFNVNAVSSDQWQRSALHEAARANLINNLQLLLDFGADINVKDGVEGRTAIFYSMSTSLYCRSAHILLTYGADVQAPDNNGLTAFEVAIQHGYPMMDIPLARLAISHAQGVKIKQRIQVHIDESKMYKEVLEICRQQLQHLKTIDVVEPVTLFTVLSGEVDTICRYVRDQDFKLLIDRYNDDYGLHPHYCFVLKTKLIEVSNLYRFKCDLANVIAKNTGKPIDFDHLVVKQISEYLTRRDMSIFIKCVTPAFHAKSITYDEQSIPGWIRWKHYRKKKRL